MDKKVKQKLLTSLTQRSKSIVYRKTLTQSCNTRMNNPGRQNCIDYLNKNKYPNFQHKRIVTDKIGSIIQTKFRTPKRFIIQLCVDTLILYQFYTDSHKISQCSMITYVFPPTKTHGRAQGEIQQREKRFSQLAIYLFISTCLHTSFYPKTNNNNSTSPSSLLPNSSNLHQSYMRIMGIMCIMNIANWNIKQFKTILNYLIFQKATQPHFCRPFLCALGIYETHLTMKYSTYIRRILIYPKHSHTHAF
eukprot:TRINITY_DN3749_c0_g2_i1.p2 TRINITY_DN3749_c0_g2~~TRINITY_DN3749_c0_g2_i1.p2  ORF type:complete len:248 (+),score=-21.60 TRINITY_DN3749_c0_g2_i1:828-1571(+)